MDPQIINNTLDEILACVCAALANGSCGCPCYAFIATGAVVPWDHCCDGGQLWVKLERMYATANFPSQDNSTLQCGVTWSADILVGILRCGPVLDDQGLPPNPDDVTATSVLVYEDMALVAPAIACCLGQAKKYRQYRISDFRPVNPQGGCYGSELRLTIELLPYPVSS